MLLNDLLKGKNDVASTHTRGGGTAFRSLLLLPTDYGVLCLVFVLWGIPNLFLTVYGLLAVLCGAFLVLAAARWFREMRRIDAAQNQCAAAVSRDSLGDLRTVALGRVALCSP